MNLVTITVLLVDDVHEFGASEDVRKLARVVEIDAVSDLHTERHKLLGNLQPAGNFTVVVHPGFPPLHW